MRKFGLIFVMVMLVFTFIGCDNGTTSGGNYVVDPNYRGTFGRGGNIAILDATTLTVTIGGGTPRIYNNVFTDGSRCAEFGRLSLRQHHNNTIRGIGWVGQDNIQVPGGGTWSRTQ